MASSPRRSAPRGSGRTEFGASAYYSSVQQDLAVITPCLEELKALGYVDGKTVAMEYRDAEGQYERLPELAAELARLSPDVIVRRSRCRTPHWSSSARYHQTDFSSNIRRIHKRASSAITARNGGAPL